MLVYAKKTRTFAARPGVNMMPTVFSSEPAEYLVERSRFIGQTFRLVEPDQLAEHLHHMEGAYPHANHYTWAYRIDDAHLRASDNGEPQGTAGMPMLNILSQQGWDQTLVVVVRYFGGIKLGRGGLVHAYQKSAQLALASTKPGMMQHIRTVRVTIDYSPYDRIVRALEPMVLTQEAFFGAEVQLALSLPMESWPQIEEVLDREARGTWQLNASEDLWRLMPLSQSQTE